MAGVCNSALRHVALHSSVKVLQRVRVRTDLLRLWRGNEKREFDFMVVFRPLAELDLTE